jgi:hypothetical protein
MKIEIKINIYYIKLINILTYILLYFIIHFIFIILLYTITILFFCGLWQGWEAAHIFYLSPRRFELLQIPHQEIILPLNYRLYFYFLFSALILMQSKHPLLWPDTFGHACSDRRLRALALKGREQALDI